MLKTTKISFLALALSALTACGGGGSGDATGSNESGSASADPQGYWVGTASSGAQVGALITDTGDIWAVGVQDSNISLLWGKGATSGTTFSGIGYEYYAGTVSTGSLNAQVETKQSLTGTITGAGTQSFKAAYEKTYETPAAQSDLAGAWNGSDGQNLVTVNIGADGTFTGKAGQCGYTGSAKAHPTKNYYTVSLTFSNAASCYYPGKTFTGVGLADKSDKARKSLLVGAASADNRAAVAMVAWQPK